MKIKNALFYVISCIIIIILAIILISIVVRKDKIARDSKTSTTTTEIMTQDTTTTTTKVKTTKKVVKTTKKTTTKKVSTMNVKYSSKNEIIQYAHNEVLKKWGAGHWEAFYNIVAHESGWNPNNVNKKSGACGLFQFVPCSKGGNAYKTDYKVQVQKGIQYIEYRYGTPNKAWAFWQKHHWY